MFAARTLLARITIPTSFLHTCRSIAAGISVLALCLGVFAPMTAVAQGYLSMNGRNHPEINWRQAETEHFVIVYPNRIAGVEVEAAAVAEETYAALSSNLGVSFDKKIRIYLSDEDEIVNGFAVPVGTGHTNIWVHLNDAAEVWTGPDKWIRKVVSHELAHIFHYRAVRSRFRPFDLGLALPRFWTEGLAQYQTEKWDAYRGERWLRTAVLDDRLSYNDGRSVWNGRLLYSVGNAQVRYFATQYGDSTLARLLSHRRRVFPGVRIHDFGYAFRSVTGESYRDFYDKWRRHINVQYNTLAGQMENADSLGVKPAAIPGQYIRDFGASTNGATQAVVSLRSLDRPLTQLLVRSGRSKDWRVVVDGAVKDQISVAPDGSKVAYTRQVRGENGSLLNDLFLVDLTSGRRTRLTHSRRAAFPSFSPDAKRLAFVGSYRGTGNLYVLDLNSGQEARLTDFKGDSQIGRIDWHPSRDIIAYGRFDAEGRRVIETANVSTGEVKSVTDGQHDDRRPLWSPSGEELAFTSLRDGVPNVFALEPGTDTATRRVTALATGADAFDWTPAGSLAVRIAYSKVRDQLYMIPGARIVPEPEPDLPPGFGDWARHRPPAVVPSRVAVRPEVVTKRTRYNALSNLTHVFSIAVPYYTSTDNYGLTGITAWTEPLGKHSLGVVLAVSATDPLRKSSVQVAYINNQYAPLIQTVVQYLPDIVRPYGNELLRERATKVSLTTRWPLTLTSAPYVRSSISLRTRYVDVEPLNEDIFSDGRLPQPEAGHQADARLSFRVTRQRPYRHNVVHPLDGVGLRLRAMAGLRSFSGRTGFVRLGAAAYGIMPAIGNSRLFAYGRVQYQRGETLAQNFIGLSRYDEFQLLAPDILEISFSDVERVRGYREVVVGKSVWFSSIEYRVPVARSLRTQLLGLVSFGATSVSVFADGALVYPEHALRNGDRRLGVGVELKNAVSIRDYITIMHAAGLAQRAGDVGTDKHELYYRIRATVPF